MRGRRALEASSTRFPTFFSYVLVPHIIVETKASDGDKTLHFIFFRRACHDADDGESGPFFFHFSFFSVLHFGKLFSVFYSLFLPRGCGGKKSVLQGPDHAGGLSLCKSNRRGCGDNM